MRKVRQLQKLENLHTDCEVNYARLLKLMPCMDEGESRRFLSGSYDEAWLQIDVAGVDRYTCFLQLTGQMGELPWESEQKMAVRLYLDARMAEVVSCGAERVRLLKYAYPNEHMYYPDEKNQINNFLGKWLEHFIRFGRPMDNDPITKEIMRGLTWRESCK